VAFIGGPVESPDNHARFQGYCQALQDRGLSVQPELVDRGDFVQSGGYQAMQRLLDRPDRPTAIFAANDEMAIGAMDAAQSRGLSIAGDIACIGFDDIQIASFARPALTTVRQPMRELGVQAAQMLLRRISEPRTPPETVQLSTHLVVRNSCGCA
jgi:LacI family transcriptional regulator